MSAPRGKPPEGPNGVLQLVTDTVLSLSQGGQILAYQPPADAELCLPEAKVVGVHLKEILPRRYLDEALRMIEAALRTGRLQTASFEIPVNSLVRELEVRMVSGRPNEVLAVVRDATDRRRLEREILEISHREQQRIGQDLHDSLGQHLTGISFLSKALEHKLKALRLPEAAQASEIAQLVVDTLGHTRTIARGLFPMELESSGRLAPALTELAANVEKLFKVGCRVEIEDGLDVRDARVSTELFRIAQEAISNAIKHGKAQRIVVALARGDSCLSLQIQDDGAGLNPGVEGAGLGRRIMRFRANRIGGKLCMATSEEGGAAVICEFPEPRRSGTEALEP
ncbi:MAG: hypothetical protein HYR88_15500 [Verrucomicrobia bacterium]|nr:hypothetical protein [Verrucomicrobiota bacterium]MBI3870385.1 hypothetical protein [Verrucomicrobiota bacterium]